MLSTIIHNYSIPIYNILIVIAILLYSYIELQYPHLTIYLLMLQINSLNTFINPLAINFEIESNLTLFEQIHQASSS